MDHFRRINNYRRHDDDVESPTRTISASSSQSSLRSENSERDMLPPITSDLPPVFSYLSPVDFPRVELGGITSAMTSLSTSAPRVPERAQRLKPSSRYPSSRSSARGRRLSWSDSDEDATCRVDPHAEQLAVRSKFGTREPQSKLIPRRHRGRIGSSTSLFSHNQVSTPPSSVIVDAVPSQIKSGKPELKLASRPLQLSRYPIPDDEDEEDLFANELSIYENEARVCANKARVYAEERDFHDERENFDDDEEYFDDDEGELRSDVDDPQEEKKKTEVQAPGQMKRPHEQGHVETSPIHFEEVSPQPETHAKRQSLVCDSQLVSTLPELMDSSPKEESMRHYSPMPSLGTVSPSEASTSESTATDNSELNLAAALVSNHRTLRAQASLEPFFSRFIDLRLGTRELAGGYVGSSSRTYLQEAQHNGYGGSTTTAQNSTSSTKRPRQTESDDNGSGEAPEDDPGAKRSKLDTAKKQRIACPFMKNSPERFSTWTTCVGPGFDEMNRMKTVD
ncbi:hypothetical protein K456DRAFT_37753 [Colletotrichum gloeosporioides 23]|nr:hypothetical protein K456DRAFT_37753 [Colletotrichum gloeosporioides 23]